MKPRSYLSRVNDIPLNFKFLIVYVICILTPIILINTVFINRFINIVYERETNNFQISMERTRTDIRSMIENCISISHSISTDRTLHSILDTEFTDIGNYYSIYDSSLRERLTSYVMPYRYVQNICLYIDNPTIGSGGSYIYIDDTVKNTEWYKSVDLTKETVLIKTYIGESENFPWQSTQFLSILSKSGDFYSFGFKKKILKIDINMDRLYSVLVRERDYITYFLLDPDNNIVCSTNEQINSSDNTGVNFSIKKFDYSLIDADNIILESNIGGNNYFKDWRLIGVTNRERMSKALGETWRFVIIFALISTLISSLLIFIMVRSYNYRLKQLSKHMLKFNDGQFDLIEINEGKDEIGGVIRNFNLMALKINTLINDVYKLELQKKSLEVERIRAELNYLQSQMNPHFLFNTLNALLVVCIKNNYTAIIDVLKYLSKILRRLLSWREDLVTIKEELEFTEMYIKIENFRFCDKIVYNILIDEELVYHKIPKMSLQPLVENACKHGVQGIVGEGRINIKINKTEKGLFVSVQDNGKGIEISKLNQIIQDMKEEKETSSHIGIRNVYRRLKLYYGNEVVFNIDSTVNAGTEIYFIIPINRLDNNTFQ